MKFTIKLFLLLNIVIVLSESAMAWDFVVSRGGATVYLDKSSIRRDGEIIQAISVSSFDKPTNIKYYGNYIGVQSITSLTSFDCLSKQFFVQESIWYSGPIAGGQAYKTTKNKNPWWIKPETKLYQGNLNVDVMKVVCNYNF